MTHDERMTITLVLAFMALTFRIDASNRRIRMIEELMERKLPGHLEKAGEFRDVVALILLVSLVLFVCYGRTQ